jgi:hypothetical protein
MNPILLVPGAMRGVALGLLVGKNADPVADPYVTDFASDELSIDSCSLCEPANPSKDPDVAMCKLSLSLDEKTTPRVKKGPFGYDFVPFM